MCVHLVGDNVAKLSTLRGMLEKRYALTAELLSHADLRGKDIEAIVVAADLRSATCPLLAILNFDHLYFPKSY